ncbi:hypothetical protein ACF1BQ_030785 [Bradyrhizobium sp. RDT10]
MEGGPLTVAIAGADFATSLEGGLLSSGAVLLTIEPGAILEIRAGRSSGWCYLSIAGRLLVPQVLGSNATHTRTGFGGLARISHSIRRIGAPNQRKFFCEKDFRTIRGAPRCRQSVAQNRFALNCLSLALWRAAPW